LERGPIFGRRPGAAGSCAVDRPLRREAAMKGTRRSSVRFGPPIARPRSLGMSRIDGARSRPGTPAGPDRGPPGVDAGRSAPRAGFEKMSFCFLKLCYHYPRLPTSPLWLVGRQSCHHPSLVRFSLALVVRRRQRKYRIATADVRRARGAANPVSTLSRGERSASSTPRKKS
jgi:hypothetical protein